MKRSVVVHLSELSLSALSEGKDEIQEDVSARLELAVRVYLRDSGSGLPGWQFPSRLRDSRSGEVELQVEVDENLWLELEEEADRQGVSVSQMAAHAAFHYAAELDSGRIAERIRDDLDAEDARDEAD
jgi:hypothetical protein